MSWKYIIFFSIEKVGNLTAGLKNRWDRNLLSKIDKSLTSTNKFIVKPIVTNKFHEIMNRRIYFPTIICLFMFSIREVMEIMATHHDYRVFNFPFNLFHSLYFFCFWRVSKRRYQASCRDIYQDLKLSIYKDQKLSIP